MLVFQSYHPITTAYHVHVDFSACVVHIFLLQKLTEMYGRLHEAHKRVLSIMQTGRRYLATYFRVGFYGQVIMQHVAKAALHVNAISELVKEWLDFIAYRHSMPKP